MRSGMANGGWFRKGSLLNTRFDRFARKSALTTLGLFLLLSFAQGADAAPDLRGLNASCKDVALADPLATFDEELVDSIWEYDCSLVGLIVGPTEFERTFVYYRPRRDLPESIKSSPVLFVGTDRADLFEGRATQYGAVCGPQFFTVKGPAEYRRGNSVVTLRGTRDLLDDKCASAGSVVEKFVFNFVRRPLGWNATPTAHTLPKDRTTVSEITRNFLAITFYPDASGIIAIHPYVLQFPGYTPVGGMFDSAGGLVPALFTDEAGVAISWVWIDKRAEFIKGSSFTPRQAAYSMAGVDPAACTSDLSASAKGIAAAGNNISEATASCDRVLVYLRGYIGFSGGRNFAADYFGRSVGPDEKLSLLDKSVRWNWMRTMYSHESGHPPVIDQDVFERGMRFGNDYIASFYNQDPTALRKLSYYSDPCNFGQLSCPGRRR